MKATLFEYRNYKALVTDALEARGKRGERSRLATVVQCHTAYISQVLNGEAHFSLEQAERVAHYLGLKKERLHFFLLLVQWARASSPTLQKFFATQIEQLVEQQFVLKSRLEFKKTLSREDQATFYSSWQYGAIHVLVSVPGCHTEQGISRYLGIPISRVTEILHFLVSVGLVVRKGQGYEIGTSHIHLENDSPMISKHHTNWRMRTVQALDEVRREDLHYSSVITASKDDSVKIRTILVRAIEEIRATVKESKDEEAFAYSLDFFGLRRS